MTYDVCTTVEKFDRQQAAADKARDECLADGRSDLFGQRYEAACWDRRVDPNERLPVAMNRTRAAPQRSRVDELPHVGTKAEAAAAERARDRCVRDGEPESFSRYYQEELAGSI